MTNIKSPIVILALNIDTLESESSYIKELKLIQDWGFKAKHVLGYYNGKSENSYVLEVPYLEDLSLAKALADSHDQECILYSDDFRRTQLIYSNGATKDIGILQNIPKTEIRFEEPYTYDLLTGYWVTR